MDPFSIEPHVVVFCNMWWQCWSAERKVEVSPVSCDKQAQVEWLHPLSWVLPSKTDQCSDQEKEVAEAWYPCLYCPWGGGAQQEDLERYLEADWILPHWRAWGASLWILKVLPKLEHFSHKGMVARAQLTALDHNANCGRKQAVVQSGPHAGQARYKVSFPKGQKQWVAKPIKEKKSYAPGLEKTPVRSSRTSRFFLRASNFLFLLAPWARTQARRSPTKFLITILRRKGKLYWLKGNQVFRWRLTKITSYSVFLLIAWCALMAQKWLPCTWSKSDRIEFLSRIKIAALGMKMLRL